jgi:hypothetical protein
MRKLNELIGRPPHRRNHHDDSIAGGNGLRHAVRTIRQTRRVGQRGSTEFLDQDRPT